MQDRKDFTIAFQKNKEILNYTNEENDIYELEDSNITDPVILHKSINFDKQENKNNRENEDIEEGFVYEEEEEE